MSSVTFTLLSNLVFKRGLLRTLKKLNQNLKERNISELTGVTKDICIKEATILNFSLNFLLANALALKACQKVTPPLSQFIIEEKKSIYKREIFY